MLPSACRCIHHEDFIIPHVSGGADKQPGAAVGRRVRVAYARLQTNREARDRAVRAGGVNVYQSMELGVVFMIRFGFEQDDGALREPLPAQAEKQWATHDRSKLAASSGRGVVVVAGKAHKNASQEVVRQVQERRASGRHVLQ